MNHDQHQPQPDKSEEDGPDFITIALSDESFDDHSGLSKSAAPDEQVPASFLMSLEEAGSQPISADAILTFDARSDASE